MKIQRKWLLDLAVVSVWLTICMALVCGVLTSVGAAPDPSVPASIPKYVTPLVIPPAMPRTREITTGGKTADYYEIAVRQFRQQILPGGMPFTTVWSYGSANHSGTFNYPAFTIEATVNRPVAVKWINDLKDSATGKFLPHLLAVDQTIHWANPPGGYGGQDSHGLSQQPYRGPVPIVTHVHGAHVADDSDGYAEAWFLPNASNIPSGYARIGSAYNYFKNQFKNKTGVTWQPGTATFLYPNTQRASTIWYHDHTLGMTRLNVYAGPAGFYLLRGGSTDLPSWVLPGPAPKRGDPAGKKYYEIPIAIQDRSFNSDGSLFYPSNRAFFEDLQPGQLQIPFAPDPACSGPSDVAPIHNPEFFGNTIVVNGKTWPRLDVEPRRYRFRFLNGCDSRTLLLKIAAGVPAPNPATCALPFWVIGADGGFLPAPVKLDSLLMSLAERMDVIVDFTGLKPGTKLYLVNEGPDDPFPGGMPNEDFEPADPNTTGQVMQFNVIPLASTDKSVRPDCLKLPAFIPLGSSQFTRKLSLNELDSSTVLVSEEEDNIVLDCEEGTPFGPVVTLLGTLGADGFPRPKMWSDPTTEKVPLNRTETWAFYNFTADAHPMHIHEVQFQVVNRQPLVTDENGITEPPARYAGPSIPPEPWETGYKDTVITYPGMVTRVKAKFDIPGYFVWHCHIVSHEDNEMMRPLKVGP